MEGDSLEQDRRFAEWYVWAKREVGTDNRVCLGAAQAAIEALVDGGDEQAARQAARGSVAGHGVALLTRIAPRRKAYAEWYDWARRELGGGRERQHVAAAAALERLDAGDDAGHAAAAARTAVSDVPAQAPAYPPGPTVAAAPPGPPAPSSAASGSAASGAPPAPDLPPAPTGPASSTAPLLPPPIVARDARATETADRSPTTGVLHVPYPHTVQPPPPEAPAHVYGGFWRRGAAWLIDAVLLTIGLAVLWFFLSVFALFGLLSSGQDITDTNLTGVQLAVLVIAIVLAWLYYAGLESSGWQATIGKRLMHLVVTDLYGRRVSFGRATGRYFGKIVSALVLFVGYLMIPFSDRRQALHDLMAGTLVVRQEHLALLTAPPRPPEPHGQQGPTGEVQQGA